MESLIEALIKTECRYGELAGGPNYVVDLKWVLTPATLKNAESIAPLYTFIDEIYREAPLDEAQGEAMASTLERDRTSEFWTSKMCDRTLTPENFLPWLQECFLAEEFYEDDGYGAQWERVTELANLVRPELFGETVTFGVRTGVTVHSLTDGENENTPYGVYVAIGLVKTLVVVTGWIL